MDMSSHCESRRFNKRTRWTLHLMMRSIRPDGFRIESRKSLLHAPHDQEMHSDRVLSHSNLLHILKVNSKWKNSIWRVELTSNCWFNDDFNHDAILWLIANRWNRYPHSLSRVINRCLTNNIFKFQHSIGRWKFSRNLCIRLRIESEQYLWHCPNAIHLSNTLTAMITIRSMFVCLCLSNWIEHRKQ